MKMETNEDSLPYIDDALTDDETNSQQYNLRIIENYHNQNRNIEITNRVPDDSTNSLGSVAPLADDTEFTNFQEEGKKKPRTKESGVKLIIRGWNSSISIQGLDHKSSITFKRKCEEMHKKVERSEERTKPGTVEAKSVEKSRKGRWRMLTRSIMLAKSAKFERKGLDERYPKYVLLKNEEEEVTNSKENYPKMFGFNEKGLKQKPEFSFKKSFKNKTEPIVPLDEILTKTEKDREEKQKQKKPLKERNVTIKKKIIVEKRKSMAGELKLGQPAQPQSNDHLPQGQVYNEIQDIFEDTLKLLSPGDETQQPQRFQHHPSVPSQFCQLSCHEPYCCRSPHDQPPCLVQAFASHEEHPESSNVQSTCAHRGRDGVGEDQTVSEEVHLGNLSFGILSGFFPRVVIMNAIPNESLREKENAEKTSNDMEPQENLPSSTGVAKDPEEGKPTLEVPHQNLTLKSKMVRGIVEPEPEIQNVFLSDVAVKEFWSLDEDQKTKSQGSEETEYLHYAEFDPPGNESVERADPATPPPRPGIKEPEDKTQPSPEKHKIEDVDESSENLSLTKIGYKMYDNLTKLSLNREKDMTQKADVSGCGCNGNGTTKSPYDITLESNNSVVKVTVPENELNFQILHSEGGDIQIGVTRARKGEKREREEKKTVSKGELWHSDDGGRAIMLRGDRNQDGEGFQKVKVSLGDSREVVFSLETNEKDKKKEKSKEKSTKEMKVGTDDFDLAGGDFECLLGQLLKHLHDKLESDEKERKFLDEKIRQKLIEEKYRAGPLPGVFLVKHLSPRVRAVNKPPEVYSRKPNKETERLREYYCEECLATMRIFEDENPSVKTMVDKFETIIQLESY